MRGRGMGWRGEHGSCYSFVASQSFNMLGQKSPPVVREAAIFTRGWFFRPTCLLASGQGMFEGVLERYSKFCMGRGVGRTFLLHLGASHA